MGRGKKELFLLLFGLFYDPWDIFTTTKRQRGPNLIIILERTKIETAFLHFIFGSTFRTLPKGRSAVGKRILASKDASMCDTNVKAKIH